MRSLVVVGLCAGCASDATALFAVPGGTPTDDFYALPFPNDLRRHDDGRLDLSLFPTNAPIATTVRQIIERDVDGFGLNAAMFARFSGPLDQLSLPSPAESMTAEASVYVIDIDPASPERGQRTPVIATFRADQTQTIGPNRLSVRPYPGFPLADGTQYALVITDRVRTESGGHIVRDIDFTALVGTGGDAAITKARDVYAPLFAWLDEPGDDERDDVVSAAVFTTQHATNVGPAIRAGVFSAAAPVARDVMTMALSSSFATFFGAYDAPNLQVGEPAYISSGGEIVYQDGAAVVQRMEPMRFAVIIPPGPVPATGFPICIYQHGTGGDVMSFIQDGTAEALAAEGIAVISTDQVLHGDRGNGVDPSIAFFNFNNPVAGRDNPLQGAADAWSQMRLVFGMTLNDGNRTIRFDQNRLFFFGHSQGGLTGPAFLAFEPAVKAAVLSGTGGVLYLSLLNKTEPLSFKDLVETLIRDAPVDEDNPTLALAQLALERADGVNYAQFMVRKPQLAPDGSPLAPRNIFLTEGFTDHYTPIPNIEAFATSLGADIAQLPAVKQLEGLTLRGRTIQPTPITNNMGAATNVLAQYNAPPGDDGHFVVFDVYAARQQSSKFLGTLAATGQATVVTAQ